jgi:PAS domain S-box-containing protein
MARAAAPAPGERPWPLPRRWRRATVRLLRSLWVQGTLALLAAYLLVLPFAIVAAGQDRQAAAIGARAESEARLHGDIGRLRLSLARVDAGVRGYALSGDPAFLRDYQVGGRQAAAAWSAAGTDAVQSGLRDELRPVGVAATAWQRWADGEARQPGARTLRPNTAALLQGDRLMGAFRAAAGRVDALAGDLAARDGARSDALHRLALRGEVLGLLLGGGAIMFLGCVLLALALRPVPRLAAAALRLAAGASTVVPYAGHRGEIGSLARALTRWQQSEVSRRAILQLSPVGLYTLGPDLRPIDANPAVRAMFGFTAPDVSAVSFEAVVHPDDVEAVRRGHRELASGSRDHLKLEQRCIRADGGVFWGGLTVAVVRDAGGRPARYLGMIEDISERKERLERAARVQRDLLPESAPELEGYQLAGLCRPSREMGGDFFDWHHQEPGELTLTLGDVMGKDMPAALLMAVVRIAMRTSASLPTVGEAVRSVAASTGRDLARAGAFVTLFHGRLDLGSGLLRYVDAGHGLMVVVGEDGVRRLPRGRSLPLGILEGQPYEELSATLEPGDTLVVFSDGVLDVHPGLEGRLETVGELLAGTGSAQEMAERLASGPGAVADDVTVVVLRRQPVRAAAGRFPVG